MQETTGDLFDQKADAICVTTNGYVITNPFARGVENVMGRGCAGEAKERWSGIQFMLGALITEGGNHAHILTDEVPEVYDGAVNVCGPILTLHASPWTGKDHEVPYHVVSFPTKPATCSHGDLLSYYRDREPATSTQKLYPGWMANSDLALIERSAHELVALADTHGLPNKMSRWESVVLPRPGCGAGELSWPMVRDILSPILDDRFYVITF